MKSIYGSKSGYVRYLRSAIDFRLGRFREFENVRWKDVQRLVFVCKGNICRSPYGEARARLMGMNAISAGLEARSRSLANATAHKIADEFDACLVSHRAQRLDEVALSASDLIIGFEPWQAHEIAKRTAFTGAQVTLLGLFSDPRRPHIEDPFGLSDEYFTTCYNVIDRALETISILMDWRKNNPVLVAHAETMGALAVIRSLGRAGYPVHAISHQEDALGFASSFTCKPTEAPDYANPAFFDWLRSYIRANNIKAIVPSEALLLALEPHYDEFAKYLPFSPSREVVYAGMSKYDLFKSLKGTANLPPTLALDLEDEKYIIRLEKLGLPLFIKTDTIYSRTGKKGGVKVAYSVESALEVLAALKPDFKRAVVQGFVPGRGVGACFVIWKGKVRAQFLHLRLHEVPYNGGVSSHRRSFIHEELRKDALAKLQQLQWQGPVMMEYRWDEATGKFYLMEMNGRFWGSLHLALYSNVDMPRVLLDAFFERPSAPVLTYENNVRCRYTFPSDVQHVWSALKEPDLSLSFKLGKVLEFFVLGLNPRVKSDLTFPGDSALYWMAFRRFWARTSIFGAVGKRLRRAVGLA